MDSPSKFNARLSISRNVGRNCESCNRRSRLSLHSWREVRHASTNIERGGDGGKHTNVLPHTPHWHIDKSLKKYDIRTLTGAIDQVGNDMVNRQVETEE